MSQKLLNISNNRVLRGIFQANLANSIFPLVIILVLRNIWSEIEFGKYIVYNSIILFISGTSDLGSRAILMTVNDKNIEDTADGVKLIFITFFAIFYICWCVITNELIYLTLTFQLFRELLMPVYKFKNKLQKYNINILVSNLILTLSIIISQYYRDNNFIYWGFVFSMFPYVHRISFKIGSLSLPRVIGFFKQSGNFALASIFTNLMQNGIKGFFGYRMEPIYLVNFELVSKINMIGKLLVNIATEYFQLLGESLQIKKIIRVSLLLYLVVFLTYFLVLIFLADYFQFNKLSLIALSLTLPFISISSFIHRVNAVLENKTIIVTISVGFGFVVMCGYLYGCGSYSMFTLINASVLSEFTIAITTIFIYYGKKL